LGWSGNPFCGWDGGREILCVVRIQRNRVNTFINETHSFFYCILTHFKIK
jgi:hypothetical protein